MSEKQKMLFIVTRGEESKETLESPLHLASLAGMLEVDVSVVYTGKAGLLLKKGTPDKLIPQKGRKPLLETIQEAKEAGVKLYICSPVLEWNNLTRDDFIDEVDDIVGGMTVVTEALDSDSTITF